MIVGYARVSTTDQTPQLQIDPLKAATCKPIYVEQKSGKNMNRPELTSCHDTLRRVDTLINESDADDNGNTVYAGATKRSNR
jgi:DNA invertase Pin-like site-specific DNA recombinase